MTFANKPLLWMLLLLPVLLIWYIWKGRNGQAEMRVSSLAGFRNAGTSARGVLRHSLFVLRLLTLALLIIILARPQSLSSWKNVSTEGINIVIALDISSSMLAEDLKPDRVEASKQVAMNFIDNRPNDRIGLVVFSGESFTQCPLTSDHAVLKNLFAGIHPGMVEDGTAIGMGLATAVSRLDTLAKSNVIILLTDGVNNQGAIDPLTAAEIAKAYKARVYTIGLGTRGKALAPVARDAFGRYQYDYVDVEIDEAMLQKVADITGGKYFRATDTEKLKKIYQEIDGLEKNIVQEKNFTNRKELFFPLGITALVLLMLEFLLRNTVFRSIT
ncbi:MAG TPA: VWA domain-containing protein [Bacteroidia bacterium]|nr:VWA domain-containing protein [Bacteroidia bacterium]